MTDSVEEFRWRERAIDLELPFANLEKHTPPRDLLLALAPSFMQVHQVAVVAKMSEAFVVATTEPTEELRSRLRAVLSGAVEFALATPSGIARVVSVASASQEGQG